jgi:hypothetical protein
LVDFASNKHFFDRYGEYNVSNKLNKRYFELQRSDISQGASNKLKVVQNLKVHIVLGLLEKKFLKIFESNTVLK